jgi:hypothetical protein
MMTENVVHYVVDRLCDDLKKYIYICTLDILRVFLQYFMFCVDCACRMAEDHISLLHRKKTLGCYILGLLSLP